jgi:integrase
VNHRKSTARAESNDSHHKGFFEGVRATNITTDMVRKYILLRQDEEAENSTINRELSSLKRMFNLARQMTPPKANNLPYIVRLQENEPRQGYFEHEEYLALKDALPSYLRAIITMAYHTGMRREEILGLQWSQVDMKEGRIALKPEDTKTKESRVIYMEGELLEVMRYQKIFRDYHHPKCPWVFYDSDGGRIQLFRKTWHNACNKVGIEGKLFHDFRRTAIRNMVRAGVPERVAMMVSGHKTRCVFERYNIVNEDDLKRASQQVTEYYKEKSKSSLRVVDGQSMGKVGISELEREIEAKKESNKIEELERKDGGGGRTRTSGTGLMRPLL